MAFAALLLFQAHAPTRSDGWEIQNSRSYRRDASASPGEWWLTQWRLWPLGSNAPLFPRSFIYRKFGAMVYGLTESHRSAISILQSSPGYEYATNCDREIKDPPRQLGCYLPAARAWLTRKADCPSHVANFTTVTELRCKFYCHYWIAKWFANCIESFFEWHTQK
jgi:hypothetical protein